MIQIRGNEFPSLLFWGATAILTTLLVGYWQRKKRKSVAIPKTWREVGELTDLTLFPMKSGAGIKLTEAECTDTGIQTIGDIQPRLKDRIFHQVEVGTVDCGDEVAAWINKYIYGEQKGLRLGYYIDGVAPKRQIATKFKIISVFKENDQGAYPDLTSYMLMTEASVNDLKSRVPPHVNVTHRQFRPNFLVRGSQPYEEDNWKWIKIGDNTIFQAVMLCTRCVFTTIDPDTGVMEPQKEPLKTLRGYRVLPDPLLEKIKDTSPVLGIHLGIRSQGIVRIGDKVYVGEE
ncbi:hypothetical protein L9F63_024925 [Diploptera punctata]|uniref:MOSC domain-containing protein n=1 Tax=Diploptera punctata TaxID=6984 RepID=A0AAD8E6T1_DIPPU|nr:hypothetical protein L9F63_024925 [Diploptera punctata]